MKKLLQEPLLHFLLLGAALFAAFSLWGSPAGGRRDEIVVTNARIESLANGFALTWQRPPTDEELDGLIRAYVREEVYCREAMALGLDRDDTVIRRRLQQKLEFVSEDVAALAEPTEADLEAYLLAHPEKFRVEARVTFDQVFLDSKRHAANASGDAARMLSALSRAGPSDDAPALGDPFLLGNRFDRLPIGEVKRLFGDDFAASLATLPLGQWHGPIASGYGTHLVLVRERTEASTPVLKDVRDAVKREWANARRAEANEAFYQGLLARYHVTVEPRRASP